MSALVEYQNTNVDSISSMNEQKKVCFVDATTNTYILGIYFSKGIRPLYNTHSFCHHSGTQWWITKKMHLGPK